MRDLLMYGDPVLSSKSEEVLPSEFEDSKVDVWFKELIKVYRHLKSPKGLAAPQIGILKRVVLCRFKKGEYTIMVNPKIEWSVGSKKSNEGCESTGLTRYIVKRPRLGYVSYQDRDGVVVKMLVGWKKLRVICHEVDHLEGICLVDVGKVWKKNGKR